MKPDVKFKKLAVLTQDYIVQYYAFVHRWPLDRIHAWADQEKGEIEFHILDADGNSLDCVKMGLMFLEHESYGIMPSLYLEGLCVSMLPGGKLFMSDRNVVFPDGVETTSVMHGAEVLYAN